MKELIKKWLKLLGPSGFEGAIRDVIRTEIASHVDDIQVDGKPKVIARTEKSRRHPDHAGCPHG